MTESAFTHTSAREVERERERERERESKTKNVFSKYAYKQLRHERKQGVLE